MIVIPILLFVSFFGLQLGMIWHARHVITAAAQDGASAAARFNATPTAGTATATGLASDAGRLISNLAVTTDRSADQVEVTVEADVVSIIPFHHVHLVARASAHIEEFIPEAER